MGEVEVKALQKASLDLYAGEFAVIWSQRIRQKHPSKHHRRDGPGGWGRGII